LNFDVPNLIGGIIFGAVGFIAFVYGKKMEAYRALGLGLALMIFPYFIANVIAMYVVGAALTAALFLWRD
jgi:hypothetical protein